MKAISAQPVELLSDKYFENKVLPECCKINIHFFGEVSYLLVLAVIYKGIWIIIQALHAFQVYAALYSDFIQPYNKPFI